VGILSQTEEAAKPVARKSRIVAKVKSNGHGNGHVDHARTTAPAKVISAPQAPVLAAAGDRQASAIPMEGDFKDF
jgi:hypothetical protein